MSINVKGFLKDVGGAGRVTKLREEALAAASPVPQPKDPIRELTEKLHPTGCDRCGSRAALSSSR